MTATQLPEPRSLRCGEPRLRGEERLLGPAPDGVLPLLGRLLDERREFRSRRKRDEPVGVEVVAHGLDAHRRQRALDRVVLRADDERAHQYFPITRPPSTRR